MSLEQHYFEKVTTPSDINEHLPTLRRYASSCKTVVECGVRDIVSSYAFACALKGRSETNHILIDPYKSQNVISFLELCSREGVSASFVHDSDLTCPIVKTDLLFIDTWHVYGQLKRELARWHASVGSYIILHDTTVDEWDGETKRVGWNPIKQSEDSGFPVDEILKGLWPAVHEFLVSHPEWVLHERFTNNNGLTILKRVSES